MKRLAPAAMSTDALVVEHDRLVRDIATYTRDAQHDRLEAIAEVIADRATAGDGEARAYAIYL